MQKKVKILVNTRRTLVFNFKFVIEEIYIYIYIYSYKIKKMNIRHL